MSEQVSNRRSFLVHIAFLRLALPFTRYFCRGSLATAEGEPFAHELEV